MLVAGGEDQAARVPAPASARKRRDPALGEAEQLVERGAGERRALGRRLHLDQAAVAGHHHVGVDLGGRVLGVVEVAERPPVDHADADRGDRAVQRHRLDRLRVDQLLQRQPQRDVAAGDRRAAGAAVGLEHVAVDVDAALAQRLEVDDDPQRAADQPLDLDPAAVLLALA